MEYNHKLKKICKFNVIELKKKVLDQKKLIKFHNIKEILRKKFITNNLSKQLKESISLYNFNRSNLNQNYQQIYNLVHFLIGNINKFINNKIFPRKLLNKTLKYMISKAFLKQLKDVK